MLWIVLTLLGAAAFGMLTVVDKRLIAKHLPSLSCYYVFVGISLFSYGLVFLAFNGIPEGAPTWRLFMAGISGLCFGVAMAMAFWGYKLEEASRASAMIQTFPVFVAILAVAFLGESLATLEWLAILIIVVGAVMISLRSSARGGPIRFSRAFPVLIGASFFAALGHLTGKYALDELPVLLVYSMRNFGEAAILLLLWRPGAFRQVLQVVRHRETLGLLVLAELVLAPVTAILILAATNLGPVSMVATLLATQPLFVFVYSAVLSSPRLRILDEPLKRSTLSVKLASVVMIIGGIGALTLL